MNTTIESTADITLSSPADLLSAVPYLLGYVPTDGFVLIGMSSTRIAMTTCTPLPQPDEPVEQLRISGEVLRRNEVTAVIIAGYGAPQRVTRCVDHTRALLRTEGIDLVEALRVTDGRYWSYLCRQACCPAEGRPLNEPHSVVDAAFTVNGMQAMPNREAVVARLESVTGGELAAVTRATNQVTTFLAAEDGLISPRDALRSESAAIIKRVRDSGELPAIAQTVRLAAALSDPKTRYQALADVDEHGADEAMRLWLWVTRRSLPPYRAEAAALLGYAAWRSGNGVMAGEAARRAVADDSRCQLAMMLARILDCGIPPSSLPKLTRRQLG
jgi:hypothetical protein